MTALITGASEGNHALKAEADIVPDETDIADNSMELTVNLTTVKIVHVAKIDMSLDNLWKLLYRAKALITIKDDNGISVQSAKVEGKFYLNGVLISSTSANTNASGIASVISPWRSSQKGDVFRFDVTNVSKDGYTYDPSKNIETSDTITVP